MSEHMTSIHLPGVRDSGYADWGSRSVTEMIALLRQKARDERAVAEAILAASDDDFHVETYYGVYVHRNAEILQNGRTV